MKKIFHLIVLSILISIPTLTTASTSDVISSIVKIECTDTDGEKTGTGVLISNDGYIITNQHVVQKTNGTMNSTCKVGVTSSISVAPNMSYDAQVLTSSSKFDLALLKIQTTENNFNYTPIYTYDLPELGKDVEVYGYPAIGGDTITFTKGYISGYVNDPESPITNYIKTDALIEFGNSGGGAFTKAHELIGIPSSAIAGRLNTIGIIVATLSVRDFLYVSNYQHLIHGSNISEFQKYQYDLENTTCNEGYIYKNNRCIPHTEDFRLEFGSNTYGVKGDANNSTCYCLDGYEWNNTKTECLKISSQSATNTTTLSESQQVINQEQGLVKNVDQTLTERLKGYILLQVEAKGAAWYLNPNDGKRYYLGRPDDAFQVMRNLGLGISNKDFNSFGSKAPSRLSGKILLKVEDNGKAYYVNPVDLKMYYLGRPADAFQLMRELALGISNTNIRKIDVQN